MAKRKTKQMEVLREGFIFGVATNEYDAEKAWKIIGEPTGEQIIDADGKPLTMIVVENGTKKVKPIRRIAEDTGYGKLLVVDVSKAPFDGHILISGVSGGGKTTAHVIPYVLNYPDSIVLGDPKTEIMRCTIRHMIRAGKNVHFLHPKRKDSSSFCVLSPLGLLDHDLLTKAGSLWSTIVDTNDEKGGGKFYKEAVKNVGEGAVLYFLYRWFLQIRDWLKVGKDLGLVDDVEALLNTPDFLDGWFRYGVVKRLHTIRRRDHRLKAEWIGMIGTRWQFDGLRLDTPEGHEWLARAPFRPTLDKVVQWMKKPASELQHDLNLFRDMAAAAVEKAEKEGKEPHPLFRSVMSCFSGWEKPSPETWANFAASVGTDLKFLNDPAINKLLCAGTKRVFMPEELFDGNTVLYICVNSKTIAANPGSVKLIYSSIAYAVDDTPEQMVPDGRTIAFVLDEVQQLKQFPLVHDTLLPEGRGKGFRLVAIIQSPEAFDEAAGKGVFNRWCGICKIKIFFGVGTPEDAKRISEMAGTINAIMTTNGGQSGAHLADDGGPASISTQLQDKPVFSPGQIMNMPEHLQFVSISGYGCGLTGKAYWFRRREFEGLVDPSPLPETFPALEELYGEVWIPDVGSLLEGESSEAEIKAKADLAEADIPIKFGAATTEEEAKVRRRKAVELGAKYDDKGGWFVPKGIKLAPFRGLAWITGLPGQETTKGAASNTVDNRPKCPKCKKQMESDIDKDKGSPNYGKSVRVCGCGHVEYVEKAKAGGRGQKNSPTTRISAEDAEKAAKTGKVGGLRPQAGENPFGVFDEIQNEVEQNSELTKVKAPAKAKPEIVTEAKSDGGTESSDDAVEAPEDWSAAGLNENVADDGYEVLQEALVPDAKAADSSKATAMGFLGD